MPKRPCSNPAAARLRRSARPAKRSTRTGTTRRLTMRRSPSGGQSTTSDGRVAGPNCGSARAPANGAGISSTAMPGSSRAGAAASTGTSNGISGSMRRARDQSTTLSGSSGLPAGTGATCPAAAACTGSAGAGSGRRPPGHAPPAHARRRAPDAAGAAPTRPGLRGTAAPPAAVSSAARPWLTPRRAAPLRRRPRDQPRHARLVHGDADAAARPAPSSPCCA